MRNKTARRLRALAISKMTPKMKENADKYYNYPEGSDTIVCPYKNFIRQVKQHYMRYGSAR